MEDIFYLASPHWGRRMIVYVQVTYYFLYGSGIWTNVHTEMCTMNELIGKSNLKHGTVTFIRQWKLLDKRITHENNNT